MLERLRIGLSLLPLTLLPFYFLPSTFISLVSPTPVHATNWNRYNVVFKSGIRHLNKGNYQKALEFFSKAIDIYKRDPAAFYNRGIANEELENYQEAIEDYKKSLTMDGLMYTANTHNNIGFSYLQLEDFDNALLHLNKAISIKSNEGSYYNNRGNVYINQEKWEKALKDFETAKGKYLKKKEKMDEYFYYDIGYIHYNLGSYQKAIDNYDKAIEINPQESMFYSDKGDALYELGEEDIACENYIKASKLGDEETKNYLNSRDGKWCK